MVIAVKTSGENGAIAKFACFVVSLLDYPVELQIYHTGLSKYSLL